MFITATGKKGGGATLRDAEDKYLSVFDGRKAGVYSSLSYLLLWLWKMLEAASPSHWHFYRLGQLGAYQGRGGVRFWRTAPGVFFFFPQRNENHMFSFLTEEKPAIP